MSSAEGVRQESAGADIEREIGAAEARIAEREKRVRNLIGVIAGRLVAHAKERIQKLKETAVDVATLRPEERHYPAWRKGTVRVIRALDAYSDFVVQRILKLSWRARAGLAAFFVVGKAAIELNKAILPAIAQASEGDAEAIGVYLDWAEEVPSDTGKIIEHLDTEFDVQSLAEAQERIDNLEGIADWCADAGEMYATGSHAVSIGAITFTLAVVYWLVRRQIKKKESSDTATLV
jgi:hypothetical protein